MTYAQKREFAARVFAEILRQIGPKSGHDTGMKIIALLAKAQLDALPSADIAEIDHVDPTYGDADADIDAAYTLAVKLAPLVGVEVMK